MNWFTKDVKGREFDALGNYQTVNYAYANASASGNTQVVAAQSSKKILVLQIFVMSSDAVSVQFESANNIISAQYALSANGGFVLPYSRHGWFQTNAGEALNVNLNGAIQTGVQVVWVPNS